MLEDRIVPVTDQNLQFLLDSTNQYARIANASDLGQPIVPLYSDYSAGGPYGTINDVAGVVLDANDFATMPGRGTSSLKMTWNGAGTNGYFQFGVGTSVPNRPRDIPDFGQAKQVRFLAQGDQAGRQLQVNIFKVNGTGFQQIASQWVSLTTGWADYNISIPALAPKDLHAVQFLMDAAHDPGGGTVRLDEIRVDADGFDPLRIIQSYQALSAPTNSAPNTPAGRDANIYPNRSFLYDNALAIIALTASGDAGTLTTARDIGGAILATAQPNGSFFNQRNSGHTLQGDGTPRSPFSALQTLGDNAWFGLALLDLYRATGDAAYLSSARSISDWAETSLKETSGSLQGYRGGFDAGGTAFAFRATEHNIDLFQLNRRISALLTSLGDSAASTYASRASYAANFVLSMFDNAQGKFWTGTTTGDTINTGSVPQDVQLWPLLTLGQWPEYANNASIQSKLIQAKQWTEANLMRTDGSFSGFNFSSATTPARVWFEGNAFAAVVYQSLGDSTRATSSLALLNSARQNAPHADPAGKGLVAASNDGLTDTVLGATYDARLAVAPTAWAYLAGQGFNPFNSDRIIRNQNRQLVIAHSNGVADAAAIPIQVDGAQVATGDQLVFSTDVGPFGNPDFRQVLVLDTNGFMRLRHLDSDTTPGDPFGTSFKLPPGLIVDRSGSTNYFLSAVVRQINLSTDQAASGVLTLDMSGTPANGPGEANPLTLPATVQWHLTILPPTNEVSRVLLDTTIQFTQATTLNPTALGNAEAFRAAEYSSSNVDPDHTSLGVRTHDADRLRLFAATGSPIAIPNSDLNAAPRNQLLFSGGMAFDGAMQLDQEMTAPLNGDPPNVRIDPYPTADAAQYRVQGYITQDGNTNENSDNVGVWASRSFASPNIPAGTQLHWTFSVAAFDTPTAPLGDILMRSATANGGNTLTLTYEIPEGPIAPFAIRFARSTDAAFDASDQTLGTVNITAAADLRSGIHQKTFSIGSGAGQIPLPGAGAPETTGDDYLLAVADPANTVAEIDATPFAEDNTAILTGAYHPSGGAVFVQGGNGADVVTASGGATTVTVKLNGTTYSYSGMTVTALRARLHDGADSIQASALGVPLQAWGGEGNDTLQGGTGGDTYYFDTDSALGNDSITESGGTDTLDFSGTTTKAVAVNLGVATAQVVNSNLTLTLGSASTVENVVGGSLNDTLTGNSLNNIFTGQAGNDTLNGQGGNDTYAFDTDSAQGNDTISDSSGIDTLTFAATTTKGVAVNLGIAIAQVVNSNLTLTLGSTSTMDSVVGGTQDDLLTGNSLNNILNGQTGDDTYFFDTDSALGNDTISESGVGVDTLNFSGTTTKAVAVNLGIGTAQVVNSNLKLALGSASTVENVVGGSLNDTLTGNSLNNTITGRGGNDIYAFDTDSALGNDTLSDSSGTDTLTFAPTTTKAVAVNLGIGTSQVVNNNLTLTLGSASTIENVVGGTLNDSLTGNSLNNILNGQVGNDTYFFDTDTALGNDTISESGVGIDTLAFGSTTTKAVAVNLGIATAQVVNSNLTLTLGSASAAENVLGGSLNDTLAGNSLNNILSGNAGNDSISGGDGRDILFGGAGADTLSGGNEEDVLLGAVYSQANNVTVLIALMSEWARTDLAYQQRIDHLMGANTIGANNAPFFLTTTGSPTVTNDAASDTETGNAALDWFFRKSAEDNITDFGMVAPDSGSEVSTAIP